MVKPYENAGILSAMAAGCLIFAVGSFAGLVVFNNDHSLDDGTHTLLLLTFSAFALVCSGLALFLAHGARTWAALDARRQAAARGEGVDRLLSAEQPSPHGALLASGTRIRLRTTLPARITLFSLLALFAAGALYDNVFLASYSHPLWEDVLKATGPLLICALLAWAFSSGPYLDILEDGLCVNWRIASVMLPWEDARLFSIYHGKRWESPRWYELAGAEFVVQWYWLRPGTLASRIYRPAIPYPEYDAQMRALLSTIATSTGLPLYDLR